MAATLLDLLRYKTSLEIKHPRTGATIKTVWVRILGDLDLQTAYKASRIVSAQKRMALRNPETDDYKDEVLGVSDLSIDEQKDLIKTARMTTIINEAAVAIERPEAPKIEEVAVDPDAASLEELEKFDKVEREVDEQYEKDLDQHIKDRVEALTAELDAMPPDKLLELAKYEISNVVPFSIFLNELNAYKAFLGTYQDKDCKIREFNTIEDFKQLPSDVQTQIVEAITNLELNGTDIKN